MMTYFLNSVSTLILSVALVSMRSVNGFRYDEVSGYLASSYMNWGSLTDWEYCPEGTFVSGVKLRVEASQGGGDDTAANGLIIRCRALNGGSVNDLTVSSGFYGNWADDFTSCNSGYFVDGMQTKVEGSQGGSDDTALNSVAIRCRDPETNEIYSVHINFGWFDFTVTYFWASNGGEWGDTGSAATCPSGSYVCGSRIRLESKQGGGDDTAMNAIHFKCCAAKPDYTEIKGYWNKIVNCGGCSNRQYSVTQGTSTTQSITQTEEYATEFSVSVSAGFSFGFGSGGVEVSASAASSIATETMQGSEWWVETTYTLECEKDGFYQWVYDSAADIGSISYSVVHGSVEYKCADNKPQCPPGYCDDPDCLTCKTF